MLMQITLFDDQDLSDTKGGGGFLVLLVRNYNRFLPVESMVYCRQS